MEHTKSAYQAKIESRQRVGNIVRYVVLTIFALIMIYPLLWLVGATFKTNNQIFTQISFIPTSIDFTPYIKGWQMGTSSFTTYYLNTFLYVIPKVFFTVLAATVVGYGFARFEFPFKKVFFALLMGTMFLPAVVTQIPLYLFFKQFGLLDTYAPLIIPSALAQQPFFVFLMIQFIRSIPRDFDEAATIDGCNSFGILWRILLPSLKPAIMSCVIFQFVWSFSDFLGPLIYITSPEKYPVSIALQLNTDVSSGVVPWNQIFAMSVISLLPAIILFFAAQRYFVEGVTSSGIKG